MSLVLKHYMTTKAKLNARNVTTSESLSIGTITILVGNSNIICGFLQLLGQAGRKGFLPRCYVLEKFTYGMDIQAYYEGWTLLMFY